MKPLAIPVIAVSLLSFYLFFYHFIFYRKQRAHKEHFYFSFGALLAGLYCLFSGALYNAGSIEEAIRFQRAQLAAGALFCPCFIYFVLIFIGKRITLVHRFFFPICFVLIYLTLFTPWVITNVPDIKKIESLSITILEGKTGPAAYLFTLWVVSLIIYGTHLLIKGYRAGITWVRPILLASVLFFITIFNDLFILLGVYQSIYLVEYGFLIITLGVAITLSNRFLKLHEQVETLNRELQEKSIQIQESEDRYRSLFEKAKDGIFLFNGKKQILLMNPYFEKLIGDHINEARPVLLQNVFKDDFPLLDQAVESLKENKEGEGFVNLEMRLHCPDSRVRDIALAVSPIQTDEGTMTFQGIARDITDQKDMQKQLLHREKIASLGVMAGGIAHEFNNSLASIMGFAQLALMAKRREDIEHYTRRITEQSERAAKITQNLLRFAHSGTTEKQELDLNQILDRSLSLVEKEMERAGIDIQREYSVLPPIITDPDQLEQVLINLYLNARDAMETGGRLVVRSSCLDRCIQIEVSDEGPGIPEKDLERIFEPFFTTKGALGHGKISGTGLGLSVCHGIMNGLGGTIMAKNNPDKGATFVIRLPTFAEAEPIQPDCSKESCEDAFL